MRSVELVGDMFLPISHHGWNENICECYMLIDVVSEDVNESIALCVVCASVFEFLQGVRIVWATERQG